MAGGPEINQNHAVIQGDKDVARLEVQVQQFALMHHPHCAQKLLEQRTNRGLAQIAGRVRLAGTHDEVLQAAALQQVHHHVYRSIGRKKIQHAADAGVRDFGQRPALVEEALQPQPVQAQFVRAGLGVCCPLHAAGKRGRQVFLDRNLLPTRIEGQVDDAETANRQVAHDPVALHKRAGRKRCGLVHGWIGVPKRGDCWVIQGILGHPRGKEFDVPVYSMTGYASAQRSIGAQADATDSGTSASAQLGLEIRCVNSRFLDLTLRLPEDVRQLEPALREAVGAQLKRGKVELRVSLDSAHAGGVADPSEALLKRLLAVQTRTIQWLPHAAPLGVADVIRLAANEQSGHRDWSADVLSLAQTALAALAQARAREGARLAEMLQSRVQDLRALAAQAEPLVPQLVEQQRRRFIERWKEAMALGEGGVTPETAQDRALTEATAFAIRIDVAEEITRLNAHLEEIARLLTRGGEVGKRLEFLIQELHREANTLGSKSAALELTRIAVDMKVLIEQMREQVQNIE